MESPLTSNFTFRNLNICAIVITHNPDEKFLTLLYELERQVAHIIVVDNASSMDRFEYLEKARQFPCLTLIENTDNEGVAAGLNQGFDKAIQLDFEWVITFDQDSKPEEDMVEKLWRLLESQTESSEIAIIAPKIIDHELAHSSRFLSRRSQFLFELLECNESWLENVTTVITTGALVRITAFKELGGFREDFFIDYVDTDFCLRLQRHGYKIVVACDAGLLHTFGHRKKMQRVSFTFYPTFHPPERWYTMSRNRIQMIKSYGLRIPHWLLYEVVATSYILIRMLLTENERLEKLSAFIRGTWDGLRGRMGKPSFTSEDTRKFK
jgi:rhamnosyltransferase